MDVCKAENAKESARWDALLGIQYEGPRTSTSRNLAVFIDGTANDEDSNTNIRKLYSLAAANGTIAFYHRGVLTLAQKRGYLPLSSTAWNGAI